HDRGREKLAHGSDRTQGVRPRPLVAAGLSTTAPHKAGFTAGSCGERPLSKRASDRASRKTEPTDATVGGVSVLVGVGRGLRVRGSRVRSRRLGSGSRTAGGWS